MELKDSQTKTNLMRAFAGESQARNRYIFAAQTAYEQNLYVLSEIFKFTASQEERDWLASLGWKIEGVAWYCAKD